MKSRLLYVVLFCFPFIFFSCSKKFTGFNLLERNKLEVQEVNYEYLSIKTKINYTDNDTKINANAVLRIKKDSIIWFSITPALGIEAARGVITRDSLIVIDRLNKTYYLANYKSLSERYNFDINYELLQAIILGNPPKNLHQNERVIRESEFALVEQKQGDAIFSNYISTRLSKLERLNITDVPTKNSLNLAFSEFRLLDDFHIFPFQSSISLEYKKPGEEKVFMTQIKIEHNKVDIEDNKRLKFPFNIPQKYEQK